MLCYVMLCYVLYIQFVLELNSVNKNDRWYVVNIGVWWCVLVLQSQFTTKSDVWSFGVTLWELLTYARQRPLHSLSDTVVVANLERMRAGNDVTAAEEGGGGGGWACPERPGGCPRETYDLMTACWSRDPEQRPSFREAHMFLQRLNAGYSPFQTTAAAATIDRQAEPPSTAPHY